jgi:hypothetical protein
MRSVRLSWFAVALLLLSACGWFSCESPIERERRELQEAGESTESVVYRGLKVTMRSAPIDPDAGPADASATKIRVLTQSMLQRMAKGEQSEEPAMTAADYVLLAKEFYELRDELRTTDEDEYPTLLAQLAGARGNGGAVPAWYGPDWEHLVLAMLWVASQKAPPGIVIYELGELDPEGIDVDGVRLAARLLRSVAFLQRGWPWLTDEEATAYLDDLAAHHDEIVAFTRMFGGATQPDDVVYAQWHAPGVLVRGLARHQKEQEDLALDDFDAFMDDAETMGLDNEGVWLIGAYVGIKREDRERALTNLRKLEHSELLGGKEKALVAQAIEAVENRDPASAFNAITDKVLIGKIVGTYVLRVLSEVDWRAELEKSESGRALLTADDAIGAEVERIRSGFSPEQLEGLKGMTLDATRRLGNEARERWHSLGKGDEGE